ncbi:unnamed protein product [Vitrella brassicaformis CCMP3155]|uniref:Uncharacterized protein n=1 Tax=Vitrella brassicaformis (strain CCMP3155) TaxID=1169540 RepID=A0A0G4FH59_VITBC|nr:unnamed protein product [Vitrella brassicaformis CCMP3155]|eukprot:CEM12752.1 unnamed protein product [Vitrella brassicaformis CCMP3155]
MAEQTPIHLARDYVGVFNGIGKDSKDKPTGKRSSDLANAFKRQQFDIGCEQWEPSPSERAAGESKSAYRDLREPGETYKADYSPPPYKNYAPLIGPCLTQKAGRSLAGVVTEQQLAYASLEEGARERLSSEAREQREANASKGRSQVELAPEVMRKGVTAKEHFTSESQRFFCHPKRQRAAPDVCLGKTFWEKKPLYNIISNGPPLASDLHIPAAVVDTRVLRKERFVSVVHQGMPKGRAFYFGRSSSNVSPAFQTGTYDPIRGIFVDYRAPKRHMVATN